jgi:hypothetical protein
VNTGGVQVVNISKALGPEIIGKLCHSYLQERVNESGDDQLSLSGAYGGAPMKIHVNPSPGKPAAGFDLEQSIALRAEGTFSAR